jgi:hypothetical protein
MTDADPIRLMAELDAEPWKAEITQTGRWRYHIDLHKGAIVLGLGWSVLGRQRAERKARRLLAKETLADQRRADAATITITGGTP